MIRLSHSRIKTWRRCHRQHHYKYIENLERKAVRRPLLFGRLMHEMMEAEAERRNFEEVLAEYRRKFSRLFREEAEHYGPMLSDARLIYLEYRSFWRKHPLRLVKINGQRSEIPFELPLNREMVLVGKVDGVALEHKVHWVIEHKTGKEVPTEDVRMRDIQTPIYAHALAETYGIKAGGVIWDYIRSKSPTRPEPLKSGELSQKNIDTLPSAYRQAIDEHDLDPADYADKLHELEERRGTWFKRIRLPMNPHIIKATLTELRITGEEMIERQDSDQSRNITRDCSWCPFEPLCRAELLQLDADSVREREFTIKPRRHDDDVEEEDDDATRSSSRA